ncbi:hypothetical protein DACRYDRAFT_21421 [Dacryopinax primogenitus]|uniref:Uncharacterized protein n=1 Tax=Dacryopinax primogenitus (strain DJM 731) TaxID=1858805 RepID=M5G328_DACPD|nr:uncharacterized protein DACRYDRAFT_21421 [Dacryopinax primogenitus]EJU03104.1 hypothetical protein DACRYDRAFT_21421 [Dacryopinax primogenitus]
MDKSRIDEWRPNAGVSRKSGTRPDWKVRSNEKIARISPSLQANAPGQQRPKILAQEDHKTSDHTHDQTCACACMCGARYA